MDSGCPVRLRALGDCQSQQSVLYLDVDAPRISYLFGICRRNLEEICIWILGIVGRDTSGPTPTRDRGV